MLRGLGAYVVVSDFWLLVAFRSTNLDQWTVDQLKMMSFGGNGRAHHFFKQHGWSDGGKIESKYTSRAAELYKQLLAKEVSKSPSSSSSSAEAAAAPPPPLSPPEHVETVKPKPTPAPVAEPTPTPASAPASSGAAKPSVAARKPMTLGVKKSNSGKASGLGVKKMVNKVGGGGLLPSRVLIILGVQGEEQI